MWVERVGSCEVVYHRWWITVVVPSGGRYRFVGRHRFADGSAFLRVMEGQ